jgi:hypothetical protein
MPADTETWYPSRYGAEDQAGALNEVTPAAVRAAAGLVRQGRIYDLGHVLDEHIPAFPGRNSASTSTRRRASTASTRSTGW